LGIRPGFGEVADVSAGNTLVAVLRTDGSLLLTDGGFSDDEGKIHADKMAVVRAPEGYRCISAVSCGYFHTAVLLLPSAKA